MKRAPWVFCIGDHLMLSVASDGHAAHALPLVAQVAVDAAQEPGAVQLSVQRNADTQPMIVASHETVEQVGTRLLDLAVTMTPWVDRMAMDRSPVTWREGEDIGS